MPYCVDSESKLTNETLTLEKNFRSTEKTIQLENGSEFKYKFHENRNPKPEDMGNLVVFVPGAENDGISYLSNIAERGEHTFDSITLEYPRPFDMENMLEGLKTAINNHEASKLVLHGTSFGGCIIHKIIEEIKDTELENIVSGAVFETSAISKKHLGSRPKRYLNLPPKILQKAAAMRDGLKDTQGSGELLDLIAALPENITETSINFPIKVITTDMDKLVDSDLVVDTLAKECGKPPQEISIQIPSSTRRFDQGHLPASYRVVYEKNAQIFDGFFENDEPRTDN